MRTVASSPPPARARLRHWPVPWAVPLVLDLALILVFAALGRRTHAPDAPALELTGLLGTAWPFLVGLAAGWAVWRVHRAPVAVWPRGVALWLTTVAVGMALRGVTGAGTAPSFVLVTLVVLAVFLLVPRTVTGLLVRRGTPRAAGPSGRRAR